MGATTNSGVSCQKWVAEWDTAIMGQRPVTTEINGDASCQEWVAEWDTAMMRQCLVTT